MLDAIAHILLIIVESMDFSPYTPQFQQKMKCKAFALALDVQFITPGCDLISCHTFPLKLLVHL